jgi:hypothetical protein
MAANDAVISIGRREFIGFPCVSWTARERQKAINFLNVPRIYDCDAPRSGPSNGRERLLAAKQRCDHSLPARQAEFKITLYRI